MRELALHILDVLQNTVEAGATQVMLVVEEDYPADRLRIIVDDNGRGMDAETAARATDPFFTSRDTRHVGLGLPLFAAAAERSEGRLNVRSQPGVGTTVEATFQLSHPDRQPLGNMPDTLLAFLLAQDAPDLSYAHVVDWQVGGRASFEFDTVGIRALLGNVPLTYPAVQSWLAEYLEEGESELREAV